MPAKEGSWTCREERHLYSPVTGASTSPVASRVPARKQHLRSGRVLVPKRFSGGRWLSFVELGEPSCKKGGPDRLIRDARSCVRMCKRALDEHPSGTPFAASFSPKGISGESHAPASTASTPR